MRTTKLGVLTFVILTVCMCGLSYAESAAGIAGLWHINSVSSFNAMVMGVMDDNSMKWFIKADGNRISIIVYTIKETQTFQTPLPIKDIDYRNDRLQILTEEVADNSLGVLYTKKYYDIRFDKTLHEAQGLWRLEISQGANDPNKTNVNGTLALKKLSDKPPTTEAEGDNSLSIQRNAPPPDTAPPQN
jgi:hypothetical protein